jgi:hypothetical protein
MEKCSWYLLNIPTRYKGTVLEAEPERVGGSRLK